MRRVSSGLECIGEGLNIGRQPVRLHRGDYALVQANVDRVPGASLENAGNVEVVQRPMCWWYLVLTFLDDDSMTCQLIV